MYTILFSHPLVEAVTTWDYSDGCWLKAPSGFVHEDNSKKPSWYALQGLIHGEWETRETLRADGDGCVSFAGFKGNYVLETGSGSAALSLESDLDGTVRLSR